MTTLALLRALLEAVAAYYRAAILRERRSLRAELKQIRHEIDRATDAGDSARLCELQDDYADTAASLDALLVAPLAAAPTGADDQGSGGRVPSAGTGAGVE